MAMRGSGLFLAFALVAAWLPAGAAGAADWRMDPAASRLEFAATFEKTAAPGVFREFDARLRFDPDRPADGRLEVVVRISSADMMSGDINSAIRGAEWFDFARFPQAEFRSADIRRVEANRYVARGTLTLKGVQQAVEVPFAWHRVADPATAKSAAAKGDAAGMEGELTLRRTAFGIGTGEWAATSVIGAEVRVRFRVRLRRDG
jgi:polyisoprenoid-binding protein YceI